MISALCFLTVALFCDGDQSVNVIRNSRVDTLIQKHILYNQTLLIQGFRINIFSESGNNSRSAALAAQSKFSETFPDVKSYVSFEEPYFKVKVGNFRTRLEAGAALDTLQSLYPNAYVVKDKLDIANLLNIAPQDDLQESDRVNDDGHSSIDG